MKKILQVNSTDLEGRRYNGYNLNIRLKEKGYEISQCVWDKQSNNKNVWEISRFTGRDFVKKIFDKIEKEASVQALLYPFSFQLFYDKKFLKSDIVHYHLIYNKFFSLKHLPQLTNIKPSVWSLHDPWAFSGHCIYPLDCDKWKTGCGECPYLNTPRPLKKDRTSFLWRKKKDIFQKSKLDIIVASPWMLDRAKKSPLFNNSEIHYIPYGINLNNFNPENKNRSKTNLGISPEDFVISFRSTKNIFKGMDFIIDALTNLNTNKSITLLTFESSIKLDSLKGKYKIIELGWLNDEEKTAEAFKASDLFLMPSIAEAFGIMAIEAMACGCPVIVFEGTSLPEIIFAPKGGISVPADSQSLMNKIKQLIDNKEKRNIIGEEAIKLVKKNYDFELYVNRHIELYKEVYTKRVFNLNH